MGQAQILTFSALFGEKAGDVTGLDLNPWLVSESKQILHLDKHEKKCTEQ